MSGAPRLPLRPRQVAALVRAVKDAQDAPPRAGRLPAIPERVLVALVAELRAEREDADPARPKDARKRARRLAAVTGLAGLPGRVSGEALAVIEEARAAVTLAAELGTPRTDAELAADLLVVWGLVEELDEAEAITAGTGTRSLLDLEASRAAGAVTDLVPDEWTPWSTLRFLWRVRKVRDLVPESLQPGVRAIPLVGAVPAALGASREMKAFQKRFRTHLAAG